jgi:hypothetical protein
VLLGLARDLGGEGVFVRRVAEASPAGARGNREYFFWLTTEGAAVEPERLLESLPLE